MACTSWSPAHTVPQATHFLNSFCISFVQPRETLTVTTSAPRSVLQMMGKEACKERQQSCYRSLAQAGSGREGGRGRTAALFSGGDGDSESMSCVEDDRKECKLDTGRQRPSCVHSALEHGAGCTQWSEAGIRCSLNPLVSAEMGSGREVCSQGKPIWN